VLALRVPTQPAPIAVRFFIPPQAVARRVTVLLDDKEIAAQSYTQPGAYSLQSPPLRPDRAAVLISIVVDATFRTPGDSRDLGIVLMSAGFVLHGLSVSAGVPMFILASAVTAAGTALHMPSVSSYISRRVGPDMQGSTLGLMQSAGSLARACGPLLWGLLYDSLGLRVPFYIAAGALALLLLAIPRLPRLQ